MPNLLETPKIISKPETVKFTINKTGWYLLSITARVKSEKQRDGSQTDDEELTLQLDGLTFPKPGTKNDLKDAPAAFSGGTQHDQEKTVQIVVALDEGEHQLVLTPQYQAMVTTFWLDPLELRDNQISLAPKIQSADRDEQPWITFALVDPGFSKVRITAKVWWRWRDGDDLQVRINGKIQETKQSDKHKNWVFHSRSILDIFGRQQTEEYAFSQSQNAVHRVQYVELWADRKPWLEEIVFHTQTVSLQRYSAGPRDEDYNRFDDEIVRAVEYWNGEFFSQELPPAIVLDPNLVKAMMYVESKMGYYQVPEGNYPAKPDVMQIADPRNPAIHTLNNDGWIDPVTHQEVKEYSWIPKGLEIMDYHGAANAKTEYESIHWAVCWLYHKAEIIEKDKTRSWRAWSDAVSRYNGGGDNTYLQKVYKIYEKGDWK